MVAGLQAYVHVLGQGRGARGLVHVDEVAGVVHGHGGGGPGGGLAGVHQLGVAGGLAAEHRLVRRGSCSGEVAAVADVVQGPDGRVVGDSCEGVSCV